MPAIYPAFDAPLPDADAFSGRSLSYNLEALDALAFSFSVVSLTDFIDARTAMLDILSEEELPANLPSVQWYTAEEGLATVQGLLSHLEKHPELLAKHRDAILADLRHFAALLTDAQAHDVKFHLLVDI